MSDNSDISSTREPFESSNSESEFVAEETSSESSEEVQADVQQANISQRGRKRSKQANRQSQTKALKDSGQCYKKYRGSGQEVPKKVLGPPCVCKLKCWDKLSEAQRQSLFSSFWKLGSHDLQNTYLYGCISKNNVKRRTKKRDTRRSVSMVYSVAINGRTIKICKNAFISLHGIGRGRVEYIVNKQKIGATVPQRDQRGKHEKHKKKYSEEDTDRVHNFIRSLPRYESHYSRSSNPNKEFMSLEYNIEILYDKFREKCQTENVPFVSSDKFRRIFVGDYNISFKTPKSDTCAICDELAVNICAAKEAGNNEKSQELENSKELHLRKAEAARTALKQAVEDAKENSVHVITFDLQQALPTPKLTTGPCFYKKKLWCYNFSVHCCNKPEQGYFFLWNESVAKRGSDEIASCLKKYVEKFDVRSEVLYAFSDNCCGQNKNWTIVGFWLQMLASGRFKKIVHIFPQVGHTMLPSDRDFALVEKYAKTKTVLYSPSEWEDVLKKSQKKHPFIVTKIERKDILNFSHLRENFSQPNFGISNCVKLEFNITNPYVMLAYDTYSGLPKPINLQKKRGRPNLSLKDFQVDLTQKYSTDLPIDESKLAHVMSCLQWIPPIHHPFYFSLRS